MTTAYDLLQKTAETNKQLYTLLRFACRCDHVTALEFNSYESAVVFLAAKNKTSRIHPLGPVDDPSILQLRNLAEETELDQKIEQLQKNELEATELLYINSPAEGNYRAMELGKYAPFVSKYILLPNTVRNGLTASQQIKLADDIQPIGLVFGINHFLQSNDDWFILEHDDIDPGITVLVNRKNVTNAFS